jgi:TRIAD3 protein (E3 ubiquitin-protein ligase RNF216)
VKLPYKRRKIPFRPINNGKNKDLYDEEFEKERAWVIREVMDGDDECEGGIECGCCFASYRFQSMVQCPEAHLFCRTCMKSYAANLLGMHDPKINCIDPSGCAAPIPESELRRFLPDGMMKLWERVKQQKEIEAAGLVGLEECPFCDYAVIIEDVEEKLLRCGNLDVCGVVSCRTCKKSNHLPKTCDEVDSVLDGRHAVEEAMSNLVPFVVLFRHMLIGITGQALFRNCPRCQKAFIKDGGCNHMTCPCGVTSCYICRQPMSNHTQPCIPPVSIKEARDQAVKEYIRDHPDVDGNQIQVSLSVRPLGKDRLKKP